MSGREQKAAQNQGRTNRALRLIGILCLTIAVSLLIRFFSNQTENNNTSITGEIFGTTYSVVIAEPVGQKEDVEHSIMTELDRLDNILSTWNRHSEISRFNSSRGTADFPCSPELREVVNTAQMVSEISGGAFDITVAPLVMAWGFGPGSTGQMIPDDEHRDEARQRVGFRKLLVTEVGLQKQHSDLEIDCSAIAKGYAVDRISELLITLGYQNHLVEIGGETRCRGYKGDGKPWRIGIQVPEAGAPASARRILRLADDAVATSGDYRNFYEHDGQRYSHTIDPRTGRPITHGLVSVTIVATTCMLADAWATACNVLGPDDAVALAREQDLCAHFIYYQEGAAKAQSISSPQFSARFEEGHQE